MRGPPAAAEAQIRQRRLGASNLQPRGFAEHSAQLPLSLGADHRRGARGNHLGGQAGGETAGKRHARAPVRDGQAQSACDIAAGHRWQRLQREAAFVEQRQRLACRGLRQPHQRSGVGGELDIERGTGELGQREFHGVGEAEVEPGERDSADVDLQRKSGRPRLQGRGQRSETRRDAIADRG